MDQKQSPEGCGNFISKIGSLNTVFKKATWCPAALCAALFERKSNANNRKSRLRPPHCRSPGRNLSFKIALSKLFNMGRFIQGWNIIFNRLHMSQYSNRTVKISIQESMETVALIYFTRIRRKKQEKRCRSSEIKL